MTKNVISTFPIQARPCVPIFGQIPFQFDPYETTTLAGYHYEPWTRHTNTARYMAGVTGVTKNIRRDAAFMAEKIFGVPVQWESDDIAIVQPRDLILRIITPAGFKAIYPDLDFSSERILPHTIGVTFVVGSLGTVRHVLTQNRVPFHLTRDGIAVPRQRACNTIIEFIERL
jgi:hypothetical protein